MKVVLCGGLSDATIEFAARLSGYLEKSFPPLELEGLFIDPAPSGGTVVADTLLPFRTLALNECLARVITESTAVTVSDLIRSESYGTVKFVALKLLNRMDFTGTFRLLEREVYFHSVLHAVVELLTTPRPQLIVFPVSPHEFFPYVISAVAQFLNIEILHFQPCPLTLAMLPKTSRGAMGIPSRATVGKSKVSSQLMATAMAQLDRLQKSSDPRYMELQRARDAFVSRPKAKLRALFSSLRWIFRERFPQAVNFSGHSSSGGFLRGIFRVLTTKELESTLRIAAGRASMEATPSGPFAVFAMHYEPERTSLPEGLPVEFQGDAITHARALLPHHYRLILKEHYSQQTSALRGFLGRSPLFYDAIQIYPNTSFASVRSKLTDLVAGAHVVFTLTGTVAIEAVLAGTPVGYFGSPWWEGLPGTIRLEQRVKFEDVMYMKVPGPDEIISFLSGLVSKGMVPGTAAESLRVLESRMGTIPEGFFHSEASSVAQLINDVIGTLPAE